RDVDVDAQAHVVEACAGLLRVVGGGGRGSGARAARQRAAAQDEGQVERCRPAPLDGAWWARVAGSGAWQSHQMLAWMVHGTAAEMSLSMGRWSAQMEGSGRSG